MKTMGKGNGGTRNSSAKSRRGIPNQEEVVARAAAELRASIEARRAQEAENAKIRKAIDRAGFKSAGVNGQWELETPYGGAQILDETDFRGEMFHYKEYGVSVWDKDYQMMEDGQERGAKRFETLNEAKRYAKELLKRNYK